jgi:hypothetical protein
MWYCYADIFISYVLRSVTVKEAFCFDLLQVHERSRYVFFCVYRIALLT